MARQAGAALVALAFAAPWAGCNQGRAEEKVDATGVASTAEAPRDIHALDNPYAYIPPACYTKTRDAAGRVHNPCFTCHTDSRVPNFQNDADLQTSYALPPRARVNRYLNLFVDRNAAVADTSDDAMLAYVRVDNYAALAPRLREGSAAWDADGDGRFSGYIPDAAYDFDANGFDRGHDGTPTGWRAFAYAPFPGAFMPTNGSMDDVLIRLPMAFRVDEQGKPDEATYQINLAIVEALVKQADVAIDPTDEARYGVDLDHDGRIGQARRIAYAFAPQRGIDMSYVGQAKSLLAQGRQRLAGGLYPPGTELLHSVRYLDVREGHVVMARRMKELRYARKTRWLTYSDLELDVQHEAREKQKNASAARRVLGDGEHGVSNGQGWLYQGFIEQSDGELRPQSYEEHVACVGCHGGIGATTDGTFALPRKLGQGRERGWRHGLATWQNVPEPRRADGRFEYAFYLVENGAGDQLRSNDEVARRFFDEAGRPKPREIDRLHRDAAWLLVPSPARALALDKAYLPIVREQSYALGREPVLGANADVHRAVPDDEVTGVLDPVRRKPPSSVASRVPSAPLVRRGFER